MSRITNIYAKYAFFSFNKIKHKFISAQVREEPPSIDGFLSVEELASAFADINRE